MIKIVKKSHTVDTIGKSVDLEGYPLQCGDKVIYYKNVGTPVRGWFIGTSPSGLTTFVLTTSDHVIKPYYELLKYNWKEIEPDPRYPQTHVNYINALRTLELVQQPDDLKKKK